MEMTVRQARVFAFKTQTEIAQSLGVCKQTYAKLENNPDLFTIAQAKKFSSLVGQPYDAIFFTKQSTLS